MNPAVKKHLRRYKRMYRRHMMMQNLKGRLLDHDKGQIPLLVILIGMFVTIGVAVGVLLAAMNRE